MRLTEGCRYQVLAEEWLQDFEAWKLAVDKYPLFLLMERQRVRRS